MLVQEAVSLYYQNNKEVLNKSKGLYRREHRVNSNSHRCPDASWRGVHRGSWEGRDPGMSTKTRQRSKHPETSLPLRDGEACAETSSTNFFNSFKPPEWNRKALLPLFIATIVNLNIWHVPGHGTLAQAVWKRCHCLGKRDGELHRCALYVAPVLAAPPGQKLHGQTLLISDNILSCG